MGRLGGGSPSGKLVQIEYALMAVGAGQTSLGIKGNLVLAQVVVIVVCAKACCTICWSGFPCPASNGVVIATEKKLPSILLDEASVSAVFPVDWRN
jgi:20S proteasome subunit alpha 2